MGKLSKQTVLGTTLRNWTFFARMSVTFLQHVVMESILMTGVAWVVHGQLLSLLCKQAELAAIWLASTSEKDPTEPLLMICTDSCCNSQSIWEQLRNLLQYCAKVLSHPSFFQENRKFVQWFDELKKKHFPKISSEILYLLLSYYAKDM